MKLYTEEQVRKAWNTAYTDALAIDEPDYRPKFYDDFIQSLTPIELPSDEEIKEAAPYVPKDAHDYHIVFRGGFLEGAKWMKDKILNK